MMRTGALTTAVLLVLTVVACGGSASNELNDADAETVSSANYELARLLLRANPVTNDGRRLPSRAEVGIQVDRITEALEDESADIEIGKDIDATVRAFLSERANDLQDYWPTEAQKLDRTREGLSE